MIRSPGYPRRWRLVAPDGRCVRVGEGRRVPLAGRAAGVYALRVALDGGGSEVVRVVVR